MAGAQADEPGDPEAGQAYAALTVTVTGRVQGVGFRAFAHDHARRLGLVGYVLNLRGGSVRVHAEGPRSALDSFLEILRRGPSGGHVREVWTTWGVASGEHDRFAIKPTL